MIDDLVPWPVELAGEDLLSERHADGVGNALTERPCRRFDADFRFLLGVSGGPGIELSKRLYLVET